MSTPAVRIVSAAEWHGEPIPKEYRAERKPKGLKPRNDERADAKFIDAFLSKEYVDWIHEKGCTVPNCRGQEIQCAHVGHTRKNLGKWFEIVPLCKRHHAEQEGKTPAFNAKYSLDLLDIAAVLALRWRARIKAR